MWTAAKQQWRQLSQGKPGQRFQAYHRRRREAGARPLVRGMVIGGGLLLVLVGLVLMPMPGPGILVAVLGACLLARESGHAARLLDRTELRILRLLGREA